MSSLGETFFLQLGIKKERPLHVRVNGASRRGLERAGVDGDIIAIDRVRLAFRSTGGALTVGGAMAGTAGDTARRISRTRAQRAQLPVRHITPIEFKPRRRPSRCNLARRTRTIGIAAAVARRGRDRVVFRSRRRRSS